MYSCSPVYWSNPLSWWWKSWDACGADMEREATRAEANIALLPQYDLVFMDVMLSGRLGAFRLGFLRVTAGTVGGGGLGGTTSFTGSGEAGVGDKGIVWGFGDGYSRSQLGMLVGVVSLGLEGETVVTLPSPLDECAVPPLCGV